MRPIALVTGVGRRAGIGAAVTERLATDGWDVAFTFWEPYEDRMTWTERDTRARAEITAACEKAGARTLAVSADLEDAGSPTRIFDEVTGELGPVRALVMAHCESVDSGILDTTVESFDRHFAVNARASWLLIREYAKRYTEPFGAGRIVAFTSDHTAGNMPYGASKGALDRITVAAAYELAHLGISTNAVNPGPVQTGWMSDELEQAVAGQIPLGRVGTPRDPANLVSFLCSEAGGWVNAQLLSSNGGHKTTVGV